MNILEQFKDNIKFQFSFFDRMIINGQLGMLNNTDGFSIFLRNAGVLYKDFKEFALEKSASLNNHIVEQLKKDDVEIKYLKSNKDKKDMPNLAREAFASNPNKQGAVAAFSYLEIEGQMTVAANHQKKIIEPVRKYTPCKHITIYLNDVEFGWMFIKIQMSFPFNVQLYINGREYMSKVFDKNGIEYEMFNNSFSDISNPEKAQKLADNIFNHAIGDSFYGILKKYNNLVTELENITSHSYYWYLQQCEYATDITFKDPAFLDSIANNLIESTFFSLGSENIYSFIGRNIKDISKVRKSDMSSNLQNWYCGYRVKFKFNANQVKMYNKGNNLRIETTINNPKDFKIEKDVETRDDGGEIVIKKEWRPMGKSISNLYRYAEISKQVNKRFIEAIPNIETNKVSIKDMKKVSSKVTIGKRTYSALNLLSEKTLSVFRIISKGNYLIKGFNNKIVRTELYGGRDVSSKEVNQMTRILAKLRAHGIIKKVARTNRYYLTTNGRKLTSSLFNYIGKDLLH